MTNTDYMDTNQVSESDLTQLEVVIDCTLGGESIGEMVFEFWPDAAPTTVRNFLRYAGNGKYDGRVFHRIIPGFMVQGGDPTGTGSGSGEYGPIRGEFSTNPLHSHKRGVISMARTNDPDSASCQFFVCHGDPDFLDGQYAAFGRMVSGDETLEKLATVPTGAGDRPTEECQMKSVVVRPKA